MERAMSSAQSNSGRGPARTESGAPSLSPTQSNASMARLQSEMGSVGTLSRQPSNAGSISRHRSGVHQSVSMLAQSMAQQAAQEDKKDPNKELVISTYKKVLKREPDVSEISHYTSSLMDEALDKVGLVEQLCKSFEFQEFLKGKRERVPLQKRRWWNKIYPWSAMEDEADEEMGTVSWEKTPKKEKVKLWETGELPGGCIGAEVEGGILFNSTKDAWNTVACEVGLHSGKLQTTTEGGGSLHIWHVKKILTSMSGHKARIGVCIPDCELDQEYRKPLFLNRAWFMDENGDVWNGNTAIGHGKPYDEQNSVISFRLNTHYSELLIYVCHIDSSEWEQQINEEDTLKSMTPCAVIRNLPRHKPLHPFIQDLYAGSGFALSQFTTFEEDTAASEAIREIELIPQGLIDAVLAEDIVTSENAD